MSRVASIAAGMFPRVTAREVAQRLAAADVRRLNATLSWSPEWLAMEAERVEGQAAGSLSGVPVAIKDNIVTTEQPTTCASRILEGYVSPFDATAVVRLRRAGAMIAAKIPAWAQSPPKITGNKKGATRAPSRAGAAVRVASILLVSRNNRSSVPSFSCAASAAWAANTWPTARAIRESGSPMTRSAKAYCPPTSTP